MKRIFFAAFGLMGGSLWFAPACGSGLGINLPDIDAQALDGSNTLPDGGGIPGIPNLGAGVGEACDAATACRPGLQCGADAKCAATHSTAVGGDCQINAECNNGFCSSDRKCVAAGTGDTGAQCVGDQDCKGGLRCNVVGLSTQCAPEGTVDINHDCALSSDCLGGLICAPLALPDGTNKNLCVAAQPGVLAIPKFAGVACEPVATTGDVTAFFDVPRGGAALKDFFRLPFPNDIRTSGGHPSYKDFPTPGSDLLGFDVVDRWARFTEKTATGFSTYGTVTFRFSGGIDFESIKTSSSTRWVDLTDSAELGHNWSGTSARSSYVCENSLSFRPPMGGVLKPNHAYAVFIGTGVKDLAGKAVARSADFIALMGASDPGGELSTAYAKYKPLRDYAAAKSIAPESILTAAVFTVGAPDKPGADMGSFVTAATAPSGWTKCEAGTVSPCAQHDDAEGRNCPATPSATFDEYHAVLKLPQYQQGKLPFVKVEDDGTFVPGAAQGTIDVCAAITMPKGATGEIPVLIYAHGTGGSFRSHAKDSVTPRLVAMGAATLGIDQVAHGTRRGTETSKPDGIFFNFTNPAAAHGNVLQGGADQIALLKYLQTGPTVGGATLGKKKIAYWGHSQGATEGAISMPSAVGISGVFFSGEGGSLIDSLLTKTSPTNIKALAPFILSERNPENINAVHPAFSMFQNGIDPADPLNQARNINPEAPAPTGIVQKHVFVPYGQKDTYATPETQRTYITAAKLALAPLPASVTQPDDFLKLGGRQLETGPVSANSNNKFTAVSRQYNKPANDDGHFVAYDDPDAIADGDKFLKTVLTTDDAPSIP